MYDKVVGPNTVNQEVNNARVHVLPKSATVFLWIFFDVYAELLKNNVPNENNFGIVNTDKHVFGVHSFIVTHSECPGYTKVETNKKMLTKWKSMSYYTSGWVGNTSQNNKIANLMDQHNSNQIIARNDALLKQVKIVFVFRNPLDQLWSYYRHQWHSKTDDHKYISGPNAASISFEDFIFTEGALESYIKTFYSYLIVSKRYPDLILFVPYEELINNKKITLQRMINHLGLKYDDRALNKAIELTSINNIKAIEDKRGTSIGGDQNIASERHIRTRDGGIGVWQDHMTPDMVIKIEKILNQYSMSLNMFFLANELNAKFSFLSTNSKYKNKLCL